MKVANIVKGLSPYGGIETLLTNLLSSERQGVDFLNMAFGYIADCQSVQRLRVDFDFSFFPGSLGIFRAMKYAKHQDCDIILAHQPITVFFAWFYRLIFRTSWHIVFFIHIDLDKIKIPSLFRDRVIKLLLNACDYIISETETSCLKIKAACPSAKCIHIFPPILSDENFQSLSVLNREKDIDAIFIGRLECQKRPQLFVQLVQEYRQRYGALNAVVVGDGSLKGEIEELCVSNDIGFLGRVSDDEKIELLKRAKVFILTSSYEGFGFVLIEALAGGAQLVSVDCPVGPREILGNGRGRLVDANPMDLSLALHDCLTLRDDSLPSRLDFAERFSAKNGSKSIVAALRAAT